MKRKKQQISVIAMDPMAAKSYGKEVEALFGDDADICVFSVKDGSAAGVLKRADLFVATTDAYGSAEELARHIPMGCQTMAIEVSFKWSELRKLKEIPAGSRVLFVNLTQTMAREAIAQLEQFGINHVTWIPYYPGGHLEEGAHIAVTPGEMRYVPASVETKIDLGQRACTSGMMIEIALRLGLEHLLETEKFQTYFSSIATSNYSFDRMFSRSIRIESQFSILMDILGDGVIGVNEKNEVFACNKKAVEITRTDVLLVMEKSGNKAFPYIPFSKCLQERQRIPVRVSNVNGLSISVEVVPVMRQKACIGAFAILQKFNEVEIRQSELRKQLSCKGNRAKYGFEDVIGESMAIIGTKDVLKRMATSESPILLIGETGTGKELFAHAVHRASKRSMGPFVAINVAALPESLLESELFGYEEGAFTGAKKGGHPGLFEASHKGTIFLDEVEGMSLAHQVKLLRVLQEREVMRVGGNRTISIDVRVVAATNESLEQNVREGKFRKDLYYRLNTLPVVIPTLAKRGDDVFLLIEHFKVELGGNFRLMEPVKGFLRHYPWPGNVRELRNVVEYFIYIGHDQITMDDLPPTIFLSTHRINSIHSTPPILSADTSKEGTAAFDNFRFVLEQLYLASEEQCSMGRDKLMKKAWEYRIPISQQEIRTILTEMANKGFVRVSKGRGGSRLTPKGREIWENG
ncbi:sigma 54-interacting transcriptional regulator [Lachnospiraceae bacterium ZAX-1]